jgi:hypothetical protein
MKKSSTKVMSAIGITAALLLSGNTSAFAIDQVSNLTGIVVEPTAKIAKKDKVAIAAFKAAMAEYKEAIQAYKEAKPTYKAQKEAYKQVMAEIKPTLVAYAQAKKVINQTFKASVAAAKTVYVAAISGEISAEAKLAAKNIFQSAKSDAVAVRAEAIAALGIAPVKPAAPVKPTKPVKPTRE